MVESIMTKSFTKIIFAAVCAILLSIVTVLVTDIAWWVALIMLIAVLASFSSTYIELKKAFENGDIVAVYGHCVSIENAVNLIGKTQRKVFSYRFISLAEGDSEASDDDVASFYIKGEKGKFVEGESYCLLFKKNAKDADMFNEGNLIGYEITKTSPVAVSASEIDEDEAEVGEEPTENEYVADESAASSKILYFSPKQKEKEDEE